MIVYITRHAQPTSKAGGAGYPPGDPPLSELGREQSRLLGKRLESLGFKGSIHSSPYRRTAETANIVAKVLDAGFHLEPALREWATPAMVHFAGLNLDGLRRDYDRVAPDAKLPDPWWTAEPEDEDDVLERVRPFLDRIVREETGDVLLVGHGASAIACMRHFLESNAPDALRKMDHTWNSFLSAIRVKPQVEALFLCDTSHMPREMVTSNSATLMDLRGEA